MAWEKALALLPADRVGVASALTACGRSRQWPTALQLLKTAPDADVTLYNAALAVLRGDQWRWCLLLLQQMRQQALRPDQVTWNALLAAYTSSKQWERGLLLLAELRSSCRADVVSTSTCLTSLPQHAWPLVLELLHQAPSKDPVLCSSAMSRLSKSSQWLARKLALYLFHTALLV